MASASLVLIGAEIRGHGFQAIALSTCGMTFCSANTDIKGHGCQAVAPCICGMLLC